MINMNSSDIKFIIIAVIMVVGCILVIRLYTPNDNMKALVYYENNLLKTIDLTNKDVNEYVVKGYNGDVVIETKHNNIRVKEEISPLNICSKQGWVSSPYQVIVCLPNKVIIKIETNTEEIDAIVR